MALVPFIQSSTWLARPRSADPYINNYFPTAYPPNPIPFYNDLSHDFLAGLLHEVHARQLNEELVVNDWIHHCPELNPDYPNALTYEDVLAAFDTTIGLVQSAQRGELETSIQHMLHLDLEYAMNNDQQGLFPHRHHLTFETQHLFRALAYVSYRCRSIQLGQVLYNFFVQHLRWIAQNNSRRPLWQWCSAILDSGMDDFQKRDCISRLQIERPDVFVLSNVRGQEGAVRKLSHLVRELVDTLQNSRRPRHRRRSSRHRSRSRSRDSSHEARDRDRLEDELRFHQDQAERRRKKLARMHSSGGSSPRSRRHVGYGQRRSALKNSWSAGGLWSPSSSDNEP